MNERSGFETIGGRLAFSFPVAVLFDELAQCKSLFPDGFTSSPLHSDPSM